MNAADGGGGRELGEAECGEELYPPRRYDGGAGEGKLQPRVGGEEGAAGEQPAGERGQIAEGGTPRLGERKRDGKDEQKGADKADFGDGLKPVGVGVLVGVHQAVAAGLEGGVAKKNA